MDSGKSFKSGLLGYIIVLGMNIFFSTATGGDLKLLFFNFIVIGLGFLIEQVSFQSHLKKKGIDNKAYQVKVWTTNNNLMRAIDREALDSKIGSDLKKFIYVQQALYWAIIGNLICIILVMS